MLGWFLFTIILSIDVGFFMGYLFRGMTTQTPMDKSAVKNNSNCADKKEAGEKSVNEKKYLDDINFLMTFDGKEDKDDE